MPQSALVSRLRDALDRAPPKRREVLIAGLQRLAVHRRQRLGPGHHYLELCPSYLRCMVAVCYETARRAWYQLRALVGWNEVSGLHIQAMDGRLRRLQPGQRHGRHLLVVDQVQGAARQVLEDVGAMPEAPPGAQEWRPVQPALVGQTLMCRCPHHDDHRPSMALNPKTWRATCFSCGSTWLYHPTRQEVGSTPLVGGVVEETVSCPPATDPEVPPSGPVASLPPLGDRWECASLVGRGVVPRSESGGFFDALTRAEDEAPAHVPVMGGLQRKTPPDALIYLDQMAVVGWRQSRGKWRPKLGPVAERHVAVDVDGIEIPNVLDTATGDELRAAGERISTWARTRPEYTGQVSLVQTSLHGVQVALELAEGRPPGWRASEAGRALCDASDALVLQELDAAGYIGGHADPTARGSGRLVRRPGLRIDKRGQPWIARLRYCGGRDG